MYVHKEAVGSPGRIWEFKSLISSQQGLVNSQGYATMDHFRKQVCMLSSFYVVIRYHRMCIST